MNDTALRTNFPTTRHWTFLDHAAVAPLPLPCLAAMQAYLEDMSVQGVLSFERWSKEIEAVRILASTLLHCQPLEVAFIPNTSTGIGLIAEGFPWRPGDNVITAEEEYPANQYPWLNLRDRGVEVRRVASRGNRIDINDIRQAMNERTRVLSLSSVEFSSGYRNQLLDLGQICRAKDIFFLVDAIQSLGLIPLDVQQIPIDGLAADGHKWLLGPEGAGIFWLRNEWLERLHPIGVGWNSVIGAHHFSTIDFRLKPHAGRWEGGTANAIGIVGLGASIQLLLTTGIAHVCQKVMTLTEHLCEGVQNVTGWRVFSSRKQEERSGIVSLIHDQVSPWIMKKLALEQKCVINVRANRVRVSPHFYNTLEEMQQLVDLLKQAEA